jgi:hypothetical protein
MPLVRLKKRFATTVEYDACCGCSMLNGYRLIELTTETVEDRYCESW